jgi:hypothetical protein
VSACTRGFAQSWSGFAKNAFEGLGSLGLLIFLTFVHLVGHTGPFVVLLIASTSGLTGIGVDGRAVLFASLAAVCMLAERAVLSKRFGQGLLPVILHPIGAAAMTAVQWHSWWIAKRGKRAWRGRVLGEADGAARTDGNGAHKDGLVPEVWSIYWVRMFQFWNRSDKLTPSERRAADARGVARPRGPLGSIAPGHPQA